MPSIDDIRKMLQQQEAGGKVREGIFEGTMSATMAVLTGVIIGVVAQTTLVRWKRKFKFREGGKTDVNVQAQTVSIHDMEFKFGKHQFATVKWLALHRPDYLMWLVDKADMFKDSPDITKVFQAALGWAEHVKDQDMKPKCFGEFSQEASDVGGGPGCDSGLCEFYFACQAHRPSKVFGEMVKECQMAQKRGEFVDIGSLRVAAGKHWPTITDSMFAKIREAADNYASGHQNNK